MGSTPRNSIIYVGLARLPQPLVAPAPALALELEVDITSGEILAMQTNLSFPRLAWLLDDLFVGKHVVVCTNGALLELEVRYSSPFAPALRVALQSAAKRALADLSQKRRVAAPKYDRVRPEPVAVSAIGANERPPARLPP